MTFAYSPPGFTEGAKEQRKAFGFEFVTQSRKAAKPQRKTFPGLGAAVVVGWNFQGENPLPTAFCSRGKLFLWNFLKNIPTKCLRFLRFLSYWRKVVCAVLALSSAFDGGAGLPFFLGRSLLEECWT